MNATVNQDGIQSQSSDEQDNSNEDHYDESDADYSSVGYEMMISRRDEQDLGQLLDAWGTFVCCDCRSIGV